MDRGKEPEGGYRGQQDKRDMKTDGGQAEGRSKLWMETEEQVDGGCRIEKWKKRKKTEKGFRKRMKDYKTKGGMEECW